MRIACLHVPHFAIQVERRENPAICGKPLIIGGYYHETGCVCDVSEEAAAYGVVPDAPLRQAYSLCPRGVFLPYSEERCRQAFSRVLSLVAQLCPLVAPAPPSHVLMGLKYETNEARFVAGVMAVVEEQMGFLVSCGIGSTGFVARLASEKAELSQALFVPDGEEQAFLRYLPLERLPVSAGTIRRLRLFGISLVGELLTLPRGAVECQFGKEGRRLYELALGSDDGLVGQWEEEEEFVLEKNFDVPVEDSGQLLEAVEKLLESLCREFRERWQCCRRLAVMLRFENGRVEHRVLHFKEPTASRQMMACRLSCCIEQLSDAAPVCELRLVAGDLCAESGTQASFLDGPPRSKEQLVEAVRVLQQRYGESVLKKVVSRRNSRLPEERFSLAACEAEK
jgi:DNA polymerase-4